MRRVGCVCVCLRVCLCLCVWRVGGWFSEGRENEDEGILQTSLLEILYNSRSMNVFDLTHILTALLGVGKFPSSLIHMLFFVFLFVVRCVFCFFVFCQDRNLLTKLVQKKKWKCAHFRRRRQCKSCQVPRCPRFTEHYFQHTAAAAAWHHICWALSF